MIHVGLLIVAGIALFVFGVLFGRRNAKKVNTAVNDVNTVVSAGEKLVGIGSTPAPAPKVSGSK